jgi:RNA-directed DNA polymerase
MGLIGFVKRLLGMEVRRDVARLAHHGDDNVDPVQEIVDLRGGPLKPHHRRLALRDGRLLPKPPPPAPVRQFVYAVRKRPKYMTADEATRLFAGTLRTRNRHIRDLKTDAAQLQRYGLPVWATEDDVAAALGISVKRLRHYSIHRPRERVSHYVSFAIPKRSGGERIIMAPKTELKGLQRKLLELLVSKLPVSDKAHGFRKGRSIRSNAEPHVGRRVVVKLDLKDFFPSVHMGRVRGLLVSLGYAYPVAATLGVLMTESVRQPVMENGEVFHVPVGPRHCVQGAPTSPALCNAITLTLDHRLSGLATRLGFAYTRYADDMSFSGDDDSSVMALISLAARIVRDEGFELRRDKTLIMRSGGPQRVTGVTVNRDLGMSRQERRKLRAALHRQSVNGGPDAVLRGKLAYLRMLNAAQADGVASVPPLTPASNL